MLLKNRRPSWGRPGINYLYEKKKGISKLKLFMVFQLKELFAVEQCWHKTSRKKGPV
jgi:hypothetical protein